MIVVKCETWPESRGYTVLVERVTGWAKPTPIYQQAIHRTPGEGGKYEDITWAIVEAMKGCRGFDCIFDAPEQEVTK